MLLKGPNLQLIPYEKKNWQLLATWFYDDQYKDMWRHSPKAWGQLEFENYPQLISGEVFIVFEKTEPVGFIQMIPDCKTNRGVFVGILLDKSVQDKHYTHETFVVLFDYIFNRLGYRKVIVEILESKDTFKKALLKSGFILEGTLMGEAFIDGVFVNEVRLCMTSAFFNKNFKKAA